MMHSRRLWRLAALLVGLLVMAACAPTGGEPTEGPTEEEATEPAGEETEAAPEISGELSVLDWSGYEVPEMYADFAAAYPDVAVTFNLGISDEDIFAKTLAGSGEDVVHFYAPFLQFYVDEGLIQPIDPARLTHWDEIPAEFQEACVIDGQVYCVPWDWGYVSILYNTEMVPEEDASTLNALFNEEYAGHISMWDSGYGAAQVAAILMGTDEANLSEDQFAQMEQMWTDQRDLNAFYWATEPELVEGFTSGDVWIAYAWNGAYYTLLSAGEPVAYAEPEEGRLSWLGFYAISATTDNYDAAAAFLDGKLGEQTGTNLLTLYAYGHVNPNYYSAVTDANLIEALSLDDPSILERTHFTVPISFDELQRFIDMWANVRAGS